MRLSLQSFTVVLCLLTTECSFEAVSDMGATGTRNSCERDSDCGEGACHSGGCVAVSATLDALLIEVSMPAAGAGDATSALYRTTKLLSDVTPEAGLDLRLDSVALISGTVKSQGIEDADCVYRFESAAGEPLEAGADGSIPVTATFIPRERLLGVPPLSYSVASQLHETTDSTHRFDVRVTPGVYDVYLVPEKSAAGSCPISPQLLLGQSIGAGAAELSLPLPPARKLNLEVVVPKGAGTGPLLGGWRVDMIEPDMGHLLSTTAVLQEPTESSSAVTYNAVLYYSPVWSIQDNAYTGEGNELVRFSPPEGEVAPTMYLSRGSLELFTEGEALVDQLSDVFSTVKIQGEVESLSLETPVASQLTFIATRIDALRPGTLASYVINTESDPEGRFSVDLLPGRYRVRVAPIAEGCCSATATDCACASAVEVEWEVSGTPSVQAGRTIQLPDSAKLSGRIVSPGGGTGLVGATVELEPSPVTTSQLDELLRGGTFTPRVASTVTGDSGTFVIAADPGAYRMWVWPGEDSGFSWLVMPQLSVGDDGSPLETGSLAMPLPIAYRGQVTLPAAEDSAEPVDTAGAMVRAYAYLDSALRPVNEPSAAESAIAVSEARVDEDGGFVLLIPDELLEL